MISGALDRHGGDVEKAFADLRDQRQKPENYYDSNLAVAADYLRARWETQRCGPVVALGEVESYMLLKQAGGVPQEGPGPVSPYSDLQKNYMEKGVSDEESQKSVLEQIWWNSPPGLAYGDARAAAGVLFGEEG